MSSNNGQIQLIIGPMYSGKSTELQLRCKRYIHARKKVMMIKHKSDDRYDGANEIVTHDQVRCKAIACNKLSELSTQIGDDYEIYGIDEGQFFDPIDLIEFCETNAFYGKIIIIAALDANYKRQPFRGIANLIPKAEKVTKLQAICMDCGKDASFTKRLDSNNSVEIEIGGSDKYKSVCRECYFALKASP